MLFTTQAAPSPKAALIGPLPTVIGAAAGRPVTGSSRSTVPSPWLATQIDPPPAVMPAGSEPTAIVDRTRSSDRAISVTEAFSVLATHNALRVATRALGPAPT